MLAPTPADACSCLGMTFEGYVEQSDVAFEGVVAAVEPTEGDGERAQFTVEKTWKGTADASTWISYGTSGMACGLGRLDVGTRLQVFANHFEGRLTTGMCFGTRRVTAGDPSPPGIEPTPADPPAPTPANRKGCASCAGGTADAGLVILLALLGIRRRRA